MSQHVIPEYALEAVEQERDELRAEVARLTQRIARDLYDEAAVSDAVAESQAEAARLREALAVFADPGNWHRLSEHVSNQVWVRGDEEPWALAHEALVERFRGQGG